MGSEIGFSELLLIGVVALLVVGPKELPGLARKLGVFVKKMRGMAMDFRHSFDDLARQAELDDLRKEIQEIRSLNPMNAIKDEVSNAFAMGEEAYRSKPLTKADTLTKEAKIAQKQAEAAARATAAEIEPLLNEPAPIIAKKPRKPRKKKSDSLQAVENVDAAN
jgi:sec-independent protein translocase protein TatB